MRRRSWELIRAWGLGFRAHGCGPPASAFFKVHRACDVRVRGLGFSGLGFRALGKGI